MMNRRGFIGSLAMATAALVLDPEKLLWVPGKKTISIPKTRELQWGWMQVDGIDLADKNVFPLFDGVKDIQMARVPTGHILMHVQLPKGVERGVPLVWSSPTSVREALGQIVDASSVAGLSL